MKLDTNSLTHTNRGCKYHIVFAPKYRRQIICGKIKQDIGQMLRKSCEYSGRERKAIQKHLKNQLQEDYTDDKISIKEYDDPFTGQPVKEGKQRKNI